ncbi:hypothetical protein QH494_20925, partial [Sphingomonas sp. AR_OL41]|uniref:hypothetical protein n=1 Tax=Sphingomonas sp. AR_OL41 TaxID=3042729 RepID=UPI00247FF459
AANAVTSAAQAAATAGAYPNSAASNVPRGLTQAGVGAITGGSGGTNGTFALAWSGGNFAISPAGTFTVSGGALTAVTITGTGLYIGATATVPTPSFTASAGLTGAVVALSAQFLVASGAGYWVQSSDNTQLLRYANVSGTATAVSGVGPVPLTFPALPIIVPYAKAAKAAVGTGSLKLLIDMDGPRTAHSGSSTIMTALTSIDDSATSLAINGTLFAGADPRPVYNARGIYLSSQAGFQYSGTLLSKTNGNFAVVYSVDLNTLTSTVSTEATLPGSPVEGDMVLVNADKNTTYTPDVKIVLDQAFAAWELVNGYFRYSYSGWLRGTHYLFKATGPSGNRFECGISHLGQLTFFMYDSVTSNIVSLISKGAVVFGTIVTFAIRRSGDSVYLYVNGQCVYGNGQQPGAAITLPNLTDLNTWYFNGNDRAANTIQPIQQGVRHFLKGAAIADDLNEQAFADLHDTVARRHGTASLHRRPCMRGVVGMGQSWFQGAVTCSDAWRHGANSWDGMVALNNSSYSGEGASVTREAFPNLFACRDIDLPGEIAPYCVSLNGYGNPSGPDQHNLGGTGENFLQGCWKTINSHPKGRETDWHVAGYGAGGATLATLAYQSVVPLVQQLKTATLVTGDYYNKTLRQIVYGRDFATTRGQSYSVDLILWQQGHSDQLNANYVADLQALYDRFCTDIKAITGQSHNPILLAPQINYSSDGTKNDCQINQKIDQKFLDMEDNRGTRPMFCIGPMYPITNFIHPYRLGHRWIGELFGKAVTRILFDGESYGCLRPYAYTYSVGGTTIDIDYRVRAGRALTLGCTNSNNIPSVVTNQGFEFIDASAGGVTISSVTVTSATRLRVTLSGVIGAGDTIRYTGTTLRTGNVADGAKVDGIYQDQDWTVSFTANEPAFTLGALNDLRQWATVFTKVL